MRAVLITRPGDPDVLELGDVVTPAPGPQQIRVRVHATAVNRADLLQRRGQYPAPKGFPQNIPGMEYAGVVDDLGAGVTRWRAGDRVMGLVGGGSYAEAVVVHEDEAIAIPASLSFEQAAAIPEAFLTAYDALNARAGIRAGESVLIHAVASGVGLATSQLAKQAGCTVYGTARQAWKLEKSRPYGVDVAIDTSHEDFVEVVRGHTDGGMNVVIDLVGGDYLGRNLEAISALGRIVIVGLVAGRVAPLDMGMLLHKRATIIGTVMRARSLGEKIEVARAFARDVVPLFESGAVVPVIDRVLAMAEAAEAHRVVEGNENVGKVVLRWE